MPCDCSIAGYCKRHSLQKSADWIALCQAHPDYFALWEKGIGPGQSLPPEIRLFNERKREVELVYFRELWNELHNKINPTKTWFDKWCCKVPNKDCGCKNWLFEYIKNNPPDFDKGWYQWTVDLHNAVNIKIRKSIYENIKQNNGQST